MSWYIISFLWLYLYFLNILYFFKFSCTNIFHRRSLCTFYGTGCQSPEHEMISPGNHSTKGLWAHNRDLALILFALMFVLIMQARSSAVVCAKLCPDWIIITCKTSYDYFCGICDNKELGFTKNVLRCEKNKQTANIYAYGIISLTDI